MKMKNYLRFQLSDDKAINVAVSHREILRIRDKLISEQYPYKVVNLLIDFETDDYVREDDLNASDNSEIRFFEIVKK